ncbi:MAG: glycosyltransferase family 4 protein [Cyanobacteria bacterium J06641_5]
MAIGYLVNQYPKVSHSFIRREILALEAQGIAVARFGIRPCADELVDPTDREELTKTRTVLAEAGIVGLLLATILQLIQRPQRWWSTLRLAIKVGLGSERGLVYHLAYFAEACVLIRWFAAAGVTHVHAHFGTNSSTVAMLCHSLGGPTFSFTVHGPEEFDKVQAIAIPEKLARAAFVVAISAFGKSQLQRWCEPARWPHIHVVRCGVDSTFWNEPFHPIPAEPRLVCVGRLSEQKGHFALLAAVKEIAARGRDFKLVLVGDGELRGAIEAEIAANSLQDKIEITGWASNAEVRQYIVAARALVLPSFAEGLPVVIMEALALARPVISTYVAGIPELVLPGTNGWLVPASDVETLVAAIERLLAASPEDLTTMGKAGLARVKARHDVDTEAAKLAHLFPTV